MGGQTYHNILLGGDDNDIVTFGENSMARDNSILGGMDNHISTFDDSEILYRNSIVGGLNNGVQADEPASLATDSKTKKPQKLQSPR